MDRERFDALARLIGSKRSRRGAFAAVLGLALAKPGGAVFAEPGRARGKGHDKDHEHGKGKGHGHQNDKLCHNLACEKRFVPNGAKPEFCCKGGFCSCGGRCCAPDDCFQCGSLERPSQVFCCTGPKLDICQLGGPVTEAASDACCNSDKLDVCDGAPGPSGIAGSYRRPR